MWMLEVVEAYSLVNLVFFIDCVRTSKIVKFSCHIELLVIGNGKSIKKLYTESWSW